MTYYQSQELSGNTTAVAAPATGILPVRHPAGIADDVGTVLCATGTIQFPNGLNPALNDVIEFCVLPADHVPLDWILSSDQLDTGAGMTVTLGVMTGTVGDVTRTQANFPAAFNAGNGASAIVFGRTASDNFARNATSWFQRQPLSKTTDFSVGLTFSAAAAANPATVRNIFFQLFYRVARYGL